MAIETRTVKSLRGRRLRVAVLRLLHKIRGTMRLLLRRLLLHVAQHRHQWQRRWRKR